MTSDQLSDFYSQPIFTQIFCVSFLWILVTFAVDCWVSPFVLKGYQLATYLLIVSVSSAWITLKTMQKLQESKSTLKLFIEQKEPSNNKKLSVKDLLERELNRWAKNVTEGVTDYWRNEFGGNDDLTREIHNQVEDILFPLSEKLAKMKVETILRNIVLILHNHLKNYLKAIELAEGSTINEQFNFQHPVCRGELSLETYLDGVSHAILQEYIPGSFQDCHTVFNLACAVFSSQVLFPFISRMSKPENILELIITFLDSLTFIDNQSESGELSTRDIPNEDMVDGSPQFQSSYEGCDEDNKENISPSVEDPYPGKGSPILAGNLVTVTDTSVKACLCSALPTLTVPLVPHCLDLYSWEEPVFELTPEIHRIPLSLPVVGRNEDDTRCPTVDDVSPVYEDVEDFATAIAKLRSLLEQRESTGSDSAKVPISPSDTKISGSGAETESSFEELTDACEIPAENHIFLNVKISGTELCTQQDGQHSVYCITYDGIYTAVTSFQDVNSSVAAAEDAPKDGRLVCKSRAVRRRFRQFLQLHSDLEACDNAAIRQSIRHIRGPSIWLNLPFSRLDKNTVCHRRMFLERYLQQLCNSMYIGTSAVLRQFLDYESDLNEVTVSNMASQRVPFLGKTVSGVLQSIKTALPLPGFDNNEPTVQLYPLPIPLAQSEAFIDRELKSSRTISLDHADGESKYSVVVDTEPGQLEQLLSTYVYHMDHRIESAYEVFESHLWRSELNVISKETEPDSAPASVCLMKDGWDRFDDMFPLSSSVVNLLVECLSGSQIWITKAPVALAVKIIFGECMEHLLQDQLKQFADPDKMTQNVQLLRQKLWKRFPLDPMASILKDQDANSLQLQVIQLLETKLPDSVRWILGKDLCRNVLTNVTSCLTHSQLNRDIYLTFLDFILSQISSL